MLLLDLDPEAAALAGLSPRESEVLQLMAVDLRSPAIADELSISASAVRNHMQAMREKLGVQTNGAAIAEAEVRGILKRRPGAA